LKCRCLSPANSGRRRLFKGTADDCRRA
jgi:hypothetical protein